MSDFEEDAEKMAESVVSESVSLESVDVKKHDENVEKDEKKKPEQDKGDTEDKKEEKGPSKLDVAMEDIMLHGGEEEEPPQPTKEDSVFGGDDIGFAASQAPQQQNDDLMVGPGNRATFVFAPSILSPTNLGTAPKQIADAQTQTSVLHRRGPLSVRDEYAFENNNNNQMWRSITWVDQDRREGVQYVVCYDTATGKCRVAKFSASAALPKLAPQYERTDDVLDVQRKFGPPGAAALCLFAARERVLMAKAQRRPKPQHQFAMPLLVRGPDNGWWNVMMPVIVTHSGGVRDLLRAWGGASCMDETADVAAHLPKPAYVAIVPPKRIGQQPASIARSATSTTVGHRREGKVVKDDYAKTDARTVVRSITWNAGGQESVQYIVRLDLIEATAHVAKFYVDPNAGVKLDWEEEMPLVEAHDRFGAPGAAASVLFGDNNAQKDANDTMSLQLEGRVGPTAVPSCAAQVGKTRVPMAFAVSKRNIAPTAKAIETQ